MQLQQELYYRIYKYTDPEGQEHVLDTFTLVI